MATSALNRTIIASHNCFSIRIFALLKYHDLFLFLIRSLRLTKLISEMYDDFTFYDLTEQINEICVILIMLDTNGDVV